MLNKFFAGIFTLALFGVVFAAAFVPFVGGALAAVMLLAVFAGIAYAIYSGILAALRKDF